MTKVNKQHAREEKLLLELQQKHGYWLAPITAVRGKNPYTSTFNFKTRVTTTKYMVVFAIPLNSALGEAMVRADKRRERKDARAKKAKR